MPLLVGSDSEAYDVVKLVCSRNLVERTRDACRIDGDGRCGVAEEFVACQNLALLSDENPLSALKKRALGIVGQDSTRGFVGFLERL